MIKKLILKLISKRVKELEAEKKYLLLEIQAFKDHILTLNNIIDKHEKII